MPTAELTLQDCMDVQLPSPGIPGSPMTPHATRPMDVLPALSPFDSVFVRTVLEHRGVGMRPSFSEYTHALGVLRRYYQQCLDNPRVEDAWEPRTHEDSLAALRAKAFVMFDVTKPSPAQWQKAQEALGPQVHGEAVLL